MVSGNCCGVGEKFSKVDKWLYSDSHGFSILNWIFLQFGDLTVIISLTKPLTKF